MKRKKLALVRRFKRVQPWLYGSDKGDGTEECMRVDAVVTRLPHSCLSVYHGKNPPVFPPGTLMVKENAKIDGQFLSAYTCENCIARAESETK